MTRNEEDRELSILPVILFSMVSSVFSTNRNAIYAPRGSQVSMGCSHLSRWQSGGVWSWLRQTERCGSGH
jgi:hypothetical protein